MAAAAMAAAVALEAGDAGPDAAIGRGGCARGRNGDNTQPFGGNIPRGRPVLTAARTSITRTSRATGRTDVDCADFDQGRSSQRHLTQQQAWDGQRHLTQQQAWDGDHAMRWGTRPGDAAGDAVGDATIGRGGGAVASTHNPSAAILSLSSCEDCDAQCPLLPRPTSSSHTLPTGSPGDRLRGIQRRASGHKSAARWFLHNLRRERRHLIVGILSVSQAGD